MVVKLRNLPIHHTKFSLETKSHNMYVDTMATVYVQCHVAGHVFQGRIFLRMGCTCMFVQMDISMRKFHHYPIDVKLHPSTHWLVYYSSGYFVDGSNFTRKYSPLNSPILYSNPICLQSLKKHPHTFLHPGFRSLKNLMFGFSRSFSEMGAKNLLAWLNSLSKMKVSGSYVSLGLFTLWA